MNFWGKIYELLVKPIWQPCLIDMSTAAPPLVLLPVKRQDLKFIVFRCSLERNVFTEPVKMTTPPSNKLHLKLVNDGDIFNSATCEVHCQEEQVTLE